MCGDSVVQEGEECDDGTESATCDADCTMAVCGDVITNAAAGEECDDGRDGDEDDGCTDVCLLPACGDGIVQPNEGEECDGPATEGVCGSECTLAQWGAARLIEDGGSEIIDAPELAIDPTGNAFAVWRSNEGGFLFGVRTQRYDIATDTWGEATRLDDVTDNVGNPSIAADAEGNAIAVWGHTLGSNAPVDAVARRYDVDTATWEPVTIIVPGGASISPFPISFDAAGNAIATVQLHTDTVDDLVAVRRDNATGIWQDSVVIESSDAAAYGNVLAVNAAGSAVTLFHVETTPGAGQPRDVMASHYDATADTWSPPVPIDGLDAADAFQLRVGIDDSDNAIATWSQRDGPSPLRWNIYTNRYDAATESWGAPTLLETDDADDAQFSDLSVSPNGDAIAAWRQSDGFREVFARRYDAASDTWGPLVMLDAEDGAANTPRVSLNTDGNAIVVWFQFDSVNIGNEIWARHYTAASDAWGEAIPITAEGGPDNALPQVALREDGTAIATWRRREFGSGYSQMAAHFQ